MSDEEDDTRRVGEENEDNSALPVFITKLLRMLQGDENHESVRWGNDGQTVLISDPGAFATVMKPLRNGPRDHLRTPAALAHAQHSVSV
jgi:hypothetical protein